MYVPPTDTPTFKWLPAEPLSIEHGPIIYYTVSFYSWLDMRHCLLRARHCALLFLQGAVRKVLSVEIWECRRNNFLSWSDSTQQVFLILGILCLLTACGVPFILKKNHFMWKFCMNNNFSSNKTYVGNKLPSKLSAMFVR